MNLGKFRKQQTIGSSLTFIAIFTYFFFTSNKHLKDIQLSYWGANEQYYWLWNLCVMILAVSILLNVTSYIDAHPKFRFASITKAGFFMSCLCLLITGIFNMHWAIHTPVAVVYFVTFPFLIFFMAHKNSKALTYKEWLSHIVISSIMIVVPLTLLKCFNGMAMAEIAHSVLVLVWNLLILPRDK